MKFLFYRKSIFFRIIFVCTLGLWAWNFLQIKDMGAPITFLSHIILSVLAALIIIFAFVPWYGFKYKGLGIDDHFEKILIPTTYILLIYNGLLYLGFSSLIFNVILSFILIVFLYVNITLLNYHLQDRDQSPPSYFAANLYLEENKEK